MTVDRRNDAPPCFGELETVFPEGDDGLRHSPDECLRCREKTECLRAAMQGDPGLRVREEKVDRAYAAGMMGFFERWKRKKAFDTRRKQSKKRSERNFPL
ncbi:MAG: hypothetical protein LJE94_13020 [Deltaproteobacteria bacterium]|jgi:hypothetical protein|nr:hypothetical protein [Deltaproteobacteria bacterium]